MDEGLSDLARAALAKRKNGPIRLVPHDPSWVLAFDTLKSELVRLCGDALFAIHHIGSTSVPGLAAKPLIDILVELHLDKQGAALSSALEPAGFVYFGAYGIDGRHFYPRRGDTDVNVHMYEKGHIEVVRHLVFRDALRAKPDLRSTYEELKRDLAGRFANDIDSYASSKSDFVEHVLHSHGAPPRPSGPDR